MQRPLTRLLLPALGAAAVIYTHSKTGEQFDVEARCEDGGYFDHGTDAQRDTLRTLNVTTMEELLIASRLDVVSNVRNGRNPQVHNVHVPVFKKHLLGFMKHKCRGLFIDCDKLLDEKVVVTGGLYPQQWFAIAPIHVTKSTGSSAERTRVLPFLGIISVSKKK